MQRKKAIILGTAITSLALLAPSSVGAATTNGYHGSTDAGGLIAFDAKLNGKGTPTRVQRLRWANLPASCKGFSPTATSSDLDIMMKVDSDGRFQGAGKVPTGAKVTLSGRFKKHATIATGTFRLKGTLPGCKQADTGSLGWEMTKKQK